MNNPLDSIEINLKKNYFNHLRSFEYKGLDLPGINDLSYDELAEKIEKADVVSIYDEINNKIKDFTKELGDLDKVKLDYFMTEEKIEPFKISYRRYYSYRVDQNKSFRIDE